MRVLVTGVTGFVGRRIAARLLEAGHTVAGLVAEADRAVAVLEEGCQEYVGDLLDLEGLARCVADFAPDAVVHLAGRSAVGESWNAMAEHFQVNVVGTENLLWAAAGVARVLFASSGEVYGKVPESEQPIPESRPPAPANPYALTKAAAELLALRSGAVIVRSFNLIGAGQAEHFALPAFARQLAAIASGRSEPRLRVGNLSARRDFLHVEDGVAGYLVLLEHGEPGQVYNLASGRARSVGDLLGLLLEVSGLEVEIVEDPERLRPLDVPVLCGDPGRLMRLGWQRRDRLEAALAELWDEAAAKHAVPR
jgi:GDP-4-dehydro-6-deoxy-D-mannose reductase